MKEPQNLSASERGLSGVLGAIFLMIAARQAHLFLRAGAAMAGVGFVARALAGRRLIEQASGRAQPSRAAAVAAIDESIDGSFPASDPPSSRLPDEPPSNAEDKWEAARAAGTAPE